MNKTYDPLTASNNFIERGMLDNQSISPMKLQKLLYFLYRDYLQITNHSLFSDRFEAWKYGPVLSCVYREFKGYGSKNIRNYYVDNEKKACKINEAANLQFAEIFNKVWGKYGKHNGITLSELTHRTGTAWHKAWISGELFLTDEDIKNEVGYEF